MMRIIVQIFFALCAFVMLILGIILDGWDIEPLNLQLFVNIPSILLVVGLTVPLTFVTYPVSYVLKAYKVSLRALNRDYPLSLSELHEAEMILELIRKLYTGTGGLGLLIGMVNMLANMDDPRKIGPAMAVAYLSLIYGLGFAELVTHPLIKRIQFRRAQESMDHPMTQGGQMFSDLLTFALAAALSIFILFMSF